MLKKLLLLAPFVCFAGMAHAQVTVDANAAADLVLSSSGTPLALGDVIRVGYFPSADLSTVENSNSYSTLNGIFTAVGEGTPGSSGTLSETGTPVGNSNTLYINNYSSTSGAFLGNFTGVSSTLIPTGDLLYMWVFNSSNPATATQWGIFDDPSSSNWEFPANLGTANLSMETAGITALRGTTNGSNYDLATVVVVPEPASFSLLAGALAFGALAVRRRLG